MIPKPPSRAAERRQQHWVADTLKRRVFSHVTLRDGRKCRACARQADPSALELVKRGHHHHVRFRSAGGKDEPSNLAILCSECHSDVHAHRLTVTGNAEASLRFERDGQEWFG